MTAWGYENVSSLTTTVISKIKDLFYNRTLLFVTLFHFCCAFILFSPFFINGKYLVGSTDNYYYIIPNLIFNLRDFQHLNFFPWNENLLGGFDMSSGHYSFLYSPLYWILFLFPEKWFFTVFTLINFIMVWLVGIFAYLFIKEEINNIKWAFFASVTYILCEQIFFSINMYPYLVGYFFSTVIVYLIWTLHKRRAYKSFIYITLSFVIMYLSCHIIRSFTLTIMILIFFFYRRRAFAINPFRFSKEIGVFYMALITSILISGIRFIPLLMAIPSSDRLAGDSFGAYAKLYLMSSRFLWIINSFIPEYMGVINGSPAPEGWLRPVYSMSPAYYGVIPIFLVIYLLFKRDNKPGFWIIYFGIATALILLTQPFAHIVFFLFYPITSSFAAKLIPPLAFCVLVGYGGKYLELDLKEQRLLSITSATIGLVLMCFLCALVMMYSTHVIAAKIGFILLIIYIVLGIRCSEKYEKYYSIYSLYVFSAISAITMVIMFLCLNYYSNPVHHSHIDISASFVTAFRYLGLSIVSASLAAFLLIRIYAGKLGQNTAKLLMMALTILAMIMVMYLPDSMNDLPTASETLWLSYIGLIRFILIAILTLTTLLMLRDKKITSSLMFFFIVFVLLVDLVPFSKRFSNFVCQAFWTQVDIQYPITMKDQFNRIIQFPNKSGYGKNIIINGSFEHFTDNPPILPVGWHYGGRQIHIERSIGEDKLAGQYGLTVITGKSGDNNIYQDIAGVSEIIKGSPVSFGAWIKTTKPNYVRLHLTNKVRGVMSKYHSGSGKWEWLSVMLPASKENNDYLRAHIVAESDGIYHVDDAALAEGFQIPPFYGTPESSIPAGIVTMTNDYSNSIAPELLADKLDIKKFRIAQPSAVFRIGFKYFYTHIPYLYGVRSFGGVMGFRSPYFLKLMAAFAKPEYAGGPGWHYDYVDSARYLDLMGCGYDVSDNSSQIVKRPSALSRFMIFENYDVIQDDNAILTRLKDASFNPRKTVILSQYPKIPNLLGEASDVDFEVKTSNIIELSVKSEGEAVVFFDDSYDPGWKAFVNDKERPVYRADYNFMATTVPAGNSKVVFRFKPANYNIRIFSLFGGLLLFFITTIVLYRYEKRDVGTVPL